MPIALLMPALSPTMKEGNLARWHKQEGDVITAGDILADIETDKATMEVEAVDEGILGRILIAAGAENVAVNTTIAWILEEGETADHLPEVTSPASMQALLPVEDRSAPSPSQVPSVVEKRRVIASPLARRIAQQNGVSLETLQGSGPHGRVVRADVEKAMVHNVSSVSSKMSSEKTPNKTWEHTAQGSSSVPSPILATTSLPLDAEGLSAYRLVPHTTMRKVIARRLCTSKQTVPHFYLSIECTLDTLLSLRQEIHASFEGIKISVNDFVIRACALALQDVPEANTGWTDEGTRFFQASDIAVAVALEGGLITPILRSAETKSLKTTASEMKSLVDRARQNKLMPEEFTGGTFSISNLGMYGVKQFQAVINPPQACILAVGAGEERAVVRAGHIQKASVMDCTLSVDHRVVDGVVGARFLQAFRDYIHHPLRLVV